jgi:hypothetical protein
MIGNESFNFVLNGHQFESTLVESIFLSPAVDEIPASDFSCRQFYISDSSIDSNDFQFFLISFVTITTVIAVLCPLRLLLFHRKYFRIKIFSVNLSLISEQTIRINDINIIR